jgi:hypothetical protein
MLHLLCDIMIPVELNARSTVAEEAGAQKTVSLISTVIQFYSSFQKNNKLSFSKTNRSFFIFSAVHTNHNHVNISTCNRNQPFISFLVYLKRSMFSIVDICCRFLFVVINFVVAKQEKDSECSTCHEICVIYLQIFKKGTWKSEHVPGIFSAK